MSKTARVLRASPPPLVALAAILLLLSSALPRCQPYTYEEDVFAINGLYTALGAPQLPNWTTNGGDPCNEGWQGEGWEPIQYQHSPIRTATCSANTITINPTSS
nr:unnamed protein product [Digitaria exilis]